MILEQIFKKEKKENSPFVSVPNEGHQAAKKEFSRKSRIMKRKSKIKKRERSKNRAKSGNKDVSDV